ncbi:glycosyltransferase family 2 protein [Vibrio owensii]|uniref:glycosyltransferase family 2 protein n=1 Tax=Vibrio owensii TaxID=696485 RepID=UPI002F3FE432
MYKISLIVPIYNTEKYIARCIDSIFSQSINELQVIFIDDGSKDKSLSILKEKLSSYQDSIPDTWDVVVISRDNKGVSKTRQEALNLSVGEYIAFLDSDDYSSSKDWLEDMYSFAKDRDLELVISDYYVEYSDRLEESSEKTSDNKLDCIKALLLGDIKGYCWNKLYKASLIRKENISFPEKVDYLEDFTFNVNFLSFAENIGFIKGRYTIYNQCNVSSITKSINETKVIEVKKAIEKVSELLDFHGIYNDCYESILTFKLNQKVMLIHSTLYDFSKESWGAFPETNKILKKANINFHFKIAIFLFNFFGIGISTAFLKSIEKLKLLIK